MFSFFKRLIGSKADGAPTDDQDAPTDRQDDAEAPAAEAPRPV
ncbi:signal recognition particle-docking protein FtsY, partial [Burkholderia sp. Cy-647]|nr:signal recognition particle-docking protein FtsY [Burkholderia sp. Cy-647]